MKFVMTKCYCVPKKALDLSKFHAEHGHPSWLLPFKFSVKILPIISECFNTYPLSNNNKVSFELLQPMEERRYLIIQITFMHWGFFFYLQIATAINIFIYILSKYTYCLDLGSNPIACNVIESGIFVRYISDQWKWVDQRFPIKVHFIII